ncbi:DUF3450 domain-containing protein [Campylobacterota bacterium DY0563]|uniref:DUF3450 domain-containing protein n=1 Tax=Halarcobacter sp. TaxID=2321133 RepID=UPI0029F45AC7|nr:DUF3450 domain-containing protein [Halarcobacter sp.]
MNLKKLSFLLIFINSIVFSNEIEKSINVIENTNNKLIKYQNQIDKHDEKQNRLIEEYRYTNEQIKSTNKYNKQLSNIISSQEKELNDIEQQIKDIEETQKNIYPLMSDMIKSLKKLVSLDTPFLLDERNQRIENLEKTLDRADIKTAEKFRIILEAFKIEYDYAKNIETYQETTDNTTFNFLRIGRVALYKQSLNAKDYYTWNKNSKTWQEIDNSTVKSNIRKGIKIAKKHENVAFLQLPFKTKEEF